MIAAAINTSTPIVTSSIELTFVSLRNQGVCIIKLNLTKRKHKRYSNSSNFSFMVGSFFVSRLTVVCWSLSFASLKLFSEDSKASLVFSSCFIVLSMPSTAVTNFLPASTLERWCDVSCAYFSFSQQLFLIL